MTLFIHLYLVYCAPCDTICSSAFLHIAAYDIFTDNPHDIYANSFAKRPSCIVGKTNGYTSVWAPVYYHGHSHLFLRFASVSTTDIGPPKTPHGLMLRFIVFFCTFIFNTLTHQDHLQGLCSWDNMNSFIPNKHKRQGVR